MKITLPVAKLKKAIKDVSPAMSSTTFVPILENILISIDGERVSVTGSDMKTIITSTFQAEKNDKVDLCLPHITIKSLLDKTNTTDITIDHDPKTFKATIISGKTKAGVAGEDAKDYPETPEMSEDRHKIIVSSRAFNDALFKTSFAVSTDDLRPGMCAINVKIADGKAEMRATDSFRVVWWDLECETTAEGLFSFTPQVTIAKTVFTQDQPLIIEADQNRFSITGDDIVISSKMQEDRFPDVDSVLPDLSEYSSLLVDKSELIQELSRAEIFADKKNKIIALDISNHKLKVTADDVAYDNHYEGEVSVDQKGDDLVIGKNVQYFKEALNHFDEDQITIYYQEYNRAIVIVEPCYKVLQMPMMLNQKA